LSKPVAPRVTYERSRQRVRAQHRDLARLAEGGVIAPNFHTHIGRPVLDANGEPVWARVPGIHGRGRYQIKYEYVPIFADPEATARVMVRAAARKATLDAKRARFVPVPRSTGEPLTLGQRASHYRAQNGSGRLTPRQHRRIEHKAFRRAAA
jgi:hypothetical protein